MDDEVEDGVFRIRQVFDTNSRAENVELLTQAANEEHENVKAAVKAIQEAIPEGADPFVYGVAAAILLGHVASVQTKHFGRSYGNAFGTFITETVNDIVDVSLKSEDS